MKLRLLLIFTLQFWALNLVAQQDYEYLGVIRLSDSTFISYKIAFDEEAGQISGYSVTDLGGPHETKSFISGYFDDTANELDFYESSILYTKSPITQDDFCYVHFNGKLRKLNERQRIEGQFKGLYADGKQCIDGEINLMNLSRILKRAERIDRKVDRTKLIPKEQREQVNLVRDLDSLNTNMIRKDERLNIFADCKKVRLVYYDAGREDGDRVSISVNGITLVRNKQVRNLKETLDIPLSGKNSLVRITAESAGSEGANTVKFDLQCGSETIETLTNLEAGQHAEFNFVRRQ